MIVQMAKRRLKGRFLIVQMVMGGGGNFKLPSYFCSFCCPQHCGVGAFGLDPRRSLKRIMKSSSIALNIQSVFGVLLWEWFWFSFTNESLCVTVGDSVVFHRALSLGHSCFICICSRQSLFYEGSGCPFTSTMMITKSTSPLTVRKKFCATLLFKCITEIWILDVCKLPTFQWA